MSPGGCQCGPHDAVCRCAEVAELATERDALVRDLAEARVWERDALRFQEELHAERVKINEARHTLGAAEDERLMDAAKRVAAEVERLRAGRAALVEDCAAVCDDLSEKAQPGDLASERLAIAAARIRLRYGK